MRKYIGYIIWIAFMGMSCDRSILEYPENGGIDPTKVHVNLTFSVDPTLEPYSKAGISTQSDDISTHDVRWIVEIFRDAIEGEPVEQRVLSCDPASDGNHSIEATFDLHAAKYHIVAWMDYVDDGSIEDKYYTVQSLSSICIPETEHYIGDEEHKEAYVGNQELDLTAYRNQWGTTINQTITLERPMAKIEFITTDVDKLLDKLKTQAGQNGATGLNQRDIATRVDVSSWQIKVEYAGYFPSSFNAYTNKPNDAREGVSFTSTMTPLSAQEARFGSDYIFVNGNESAVYVNLTILDDQGNLLNQVQGIEVPIVRGKLTSIRDEFLTQDFKPGIGIDPGFDGDIDIVIPD